MGAGIHNESGNIPARAHLNRRCLGYESRDPSWPLADIGGLTFRFRGAKRICHNRHGAIRPCGAVRREHFCPADLLCRNHPGCIGAGISRAT